MNLNSISNTILDETSSFEQLCNALNAFSLLCSEATGVSPDPSFDAWADDALLDNGVAINPQAAAHCVVDYARSVAFIRGVSAAIDTLKLRFPGSSLEILYAGCGPFATLLLPVLGKFLPGELKLYLLDVHQRSLDSVQRLLTEFGFCAHSVQLIKADASTYLHPGKLHLVIAETMQKSLEQEPQFAVTANLAPQLCPKGVFIPQHIEVSMYMADLDHERRLMDYPRLENDSQEGGRAGSGQRRYRLGTVCSLSPEHAFDQLQRARENSTGVVPALEPTIVEITSIADISRFDAVLFTRICVFEHYRLKDYESQITLPSKCFELSDLVGGERFRVTYQLGSYPRFNFERLPKA